MDESGTLSEEDTPPPAARACRDARFEIMKTYAFIQTDEEREHRGTWIDPTVDTIFLWDHLKGEETSCEMLSGDINDLDLFDRNIERMLRNDRSWALGTSLEPSNLNEKCHVAIHESIFWNFRDNNFVGEKQHFLAFLQDGDYATLTFVWSMSDAKYSDHDEMELVDEGDDHNWNRHLSQHRRGAIEHELSCLTSYRFPDFKVPVFKMARVQKRGFQEGPPEWWRLFLVNGSWY